MYDKKQLSFLETQCHAHGLDLFHTFHTSWYNDLIEREGHVQSGVLKTLPCAISCSSEKVCSNVNEHDHTTLQRLDSTFLNCS